MKSASLAQIQFRARQLQVRQATEDEDFNGADAFLNSLGVAHRLRAIEATVYEEINVRKRDYSKSEYEKILDGECLAGLWIFEFSDAYILCATVDIKNCLLRGKGHYIHNKGEPNGFYSIHFSQIPHLRIDKEALYGQRNNQV